MHRAAPPEIWEAIFHQVTSRGGTDAPPLHNIHFHYNRHDLQQRRIRRAVETKLCIAQVCKSWRELVEPVLYEHLVLNDKRFASLDSLIPLMSANACNGKQRGELVYRLDISAPNELPDTDVTRIIRLFQQLQQLLDLLPNLKVLVFRHSFSYRVATALREANFLLSVSSALESISWIDEKWSPSLLRVPESIWTPFLQSHPNLKTVQRPKIDVPPEVYWDEPEASLLSKPMVGVTEMVMRLEWILAQPDLYLLPGEGGQDLFPNLRRVVFQIPIVGPMDMEMMGGEISLPTMLEVHGHKITSMDCVYHEILSEDSPQLQFFPMVAQHCTNLEELGLFFNWRSRRYKGGQWREDVVWHFELPCELPTVRLLKVRRMNRRFDVGAYREMLALVRKATTGGKLPNCTTVQFTSERDIIYFSKHRELFTSDLAFLWAQDLVLLDHRGLTLDLDRGPIRSI